MDFRGVDIFYLEETIWLGSKSVGVPAYDFAFEPLFHCRRPYELPSNKQLICRVGAFNGYEKAYSDLNDIGFKLVNSVEEHFRASELSQWYPLIEKYTPRSKWYEQIPDVTEIENEFSYPLFIKGSRQTAKHKESLSVARNRDECDFILKEYQLNPILHWQQLVCREFVQLMPVKAAQTEKVSPSYEFRSFWYKGVLVGVGHYWSEFVKYGWSKEQEISALKIAKEVSDIVKVSFLVIDLALTINGNWIVIECNDGQESGYAGIDPIRLWNNIIEIERI
ncbi:MAG: ATP-grasp domain-containing protein [Candidatus Thiodiazotropha sp.]